MYGVHVTCHPTTSTTRFPEDNNIQTGKHQGTISAHRCSILSSLARSSSSVRSPRSKSCALCMASKSEVRSQSLVDLGGAAAEHGSAIQSPPNPNHVPAPKTLARGPWLHCAPIRCALKFEPIVTPPLFRRACACARAHTHTHTHTPLTQCCGDKFGDPIQYLSFGHVRMRARFEFEAKASPWALSAAR